ncbi:MAG: hypothetical protein K2G36_00005, partial [Ruminococcus sp.]|nr:hypothetical protein [Ruminococcus sp.]
PERRVSGFNVLSKTAPKIVGLISDQLNTLLAPFRSRLTISSVNRGISMFSLFKRIRPFELAHGNTETSSSISST